MKNKTSFIILFLLCFNIVFGQTDSNSISLTNSDVTKAGTIYQSNSYAKAPDTFRNIRKEKAEVLVTEKNIITTLGDSSLTYEVIKKYNINKVNGIGYRLYLEGSPDVYYDLCISKSDKSKDPYYFLDFFSDDNKVIWRMREAKIIKQ